MLFRNNNPDKGTETVTCVAKAGGVSDSFRNNNPDKGTETNKAIFKEITGINIGLEIITPIRGRKPDFVPLETVHIMEPFRNNNPDKGTETVFKILPPTICRV